MLVLGLQVLLSKGVEEGKILFLSLIAAPEGIHRICSAFPRVKLITSEIDEGIAPDYQVVPGKAVNDIALDWHNTISLAASGWPFPCWIICAYVSCQHV